MDYVGLSVAVVALTFTVASFWWLHARRGRLAVASSFSWSGFSEHTGNSRLRFPLTFANTGPVSIVVLDLRLVIEGEGAEVMLPWTSVRAGVRPTEDDFLDLASHLVVEGRSAQTWFLEFGGHGADAFKMKPGADYSVRVEGKYHWATGSQREGRWTHLVTVPLRGPSADQISSYITHVTSDRLGSGNTGPCCEAHSPSG